MSERTERLTEAFAALHRGDLSQFRDLFVDDARWLGVAGTGVDGRTPT